MPRAGGCSTLLAVLSLLVTPASIAAQVAGTAALTGAVTDPSGAIVVGADVTATNLATGAKRSARTDSAGKYLIAQVPPGDYRVEVTANGFKTAARPQVELPIGITSSLDVVLELGAIAEVVEVQAVAATVNTTDASMGTPLTGAEIRSLPSLDLNPAGLLSLQTGVAFVPSAADTPGGYGGVSDFDGRSGAVNGARSDQTNITLDGVDCNDPISGYAFTCVLRATQASLAEFRTTTSNYGAEAGGRSGAAQVQLITSSGQNAAHGSAYYAHRNEALNANDFFLNKSGIKEPKFRRHIYGGAVGGPLVQNRLFLFGNWERMEESLFKSAVRNVPSLSFRDGVMIYQCEDREEFAPCPTSPTTVTGVSGTSYSVPAGSYGLSPAQIAAIDPLGIGPNAALLRYWSEYPTELNDSSVGDGVNVVGHRFAAPISNTFNTYIGRLDFNAAANHTVFLRATLQDDTVAQEPAYLGGDPIRTTETGNRGVALGHTWVLSPRLVNNLRYGYTRIKLDNVGVRNAEFANVRFVDDLNGFDDPGLPAGTASTLNRSTPTHHIRDDLSWTLGAHSFTVGGEARFVRNDRASDALAFHTFTVNPSWLPDGGRSIEPGQVDCDRPGCFAVPASAGVNFRDRLTLMLGPISQVDAAYNFNALGETLAEGAIVPRRFAANEYEFYLQDQWRVHPSLTLSLGLRYSNATPPWETNGNQVIPVPVDPSLDGSFGAWFECRDQMRLAGRPTADCGLIETQLGGAANDGRPYFDRDNNNFSPRIGAAWAPRFERGLLGRIFGDARMSIRGGYSLVYDRIGMGLINTFDQVGAFGLSTSITNQLGGCNIGATGGVEPCVRWTGLSDTDAAANNVLSNGDVQLAPSPGASFPAIPPSDLLTVSNGLDDTIRSPHAHMIDFSISRELPGGFTVEAAYVGRRGRNLPLLRDFATAADVCDPQTGVCAFEAARELVRLSDAGQPLDTLAPIPFWENMFPDFGPSGPNGGCLQFGQLGPFGECGYSATQVAYDYIIGYHGTAETGSGFGTSTFWQDVDFFAFPGFSSLGQYTFFPAQWVALNTWSTIGRSEYHALQLSARRRMSQGLAFAVNYTLSKSLDHSSTPERQEPTGAFFTGGYTGSAINAWEPDLEYSYSDFDMRHQLNAYFTWELPFGRDRRWGSGVSGFVDQLIGGWQVSGVMRFSTGLPANAINGRTWPTNWNLQGNATCAPPREGLNFGLDHGPCPATATTNGALNEGASEPNPNVFANPDDARQSFRFSAMGERGQRNVLRGDGYGTADLAFSKSFRMAYARNHNLAVRLEIFNLTNTPYFDTASLNLSLEDPATFGQYSAMLGGPRRMQVFLRYEF